MTYQEIAQKLESWNIKGATFGHFGNIISQHKNVHNFSLPTLLSYFSFNEMLTHRYQPLLLCNGMLMLPSPQGRYKTFCYNPSPESSKEILEFLQTIGPIYSLYQIPFLTKEVKFVEVGYNLDKVFDPASYENAKKRYQRLVYPFNHMQKCNVTVTQLNDATFQKVEELHEEWAKRKLDDPDTFKMMFPNKRYIRCCEYAAADQVNFRNFVFMIDEKVIAVRVLGVAGQLVVDLANFGRTWDMPSNMMNSLDTYVLKALHTEGYKTFNCGAALNKKLKVFKCHYPSDDIISYQYSRNKETSNV